MTLPLEEDRLSNLPDSILLHILSFLDTQQAYQTPILSKRWNNNLVNHIPALRFDPLALNRVKYDFDDVLSRVLTHRDDSTSLHTLEIFNLDDIFGSCMLETMIEYAVSHHVHHILTSIPFDFQDIIPCLLTSKTLTSLYLSVHDYRGRGRMLFPSSLNFPALTTLSLHAFYFQSDHNGCAEPFSAFNKLNTLDITNCIVSNAYKYEKQQQKVLCISSATLVNLDIDGDIRCKVKLSSPSLCNFITLGAVNVEVCKTHICSVKHFEIIAGYPEDAPGVLSCLQQLTNIKSLIVTSNVLQALCFIPDLFEVKFTSLCNLESLQVQMTMSILPRETYKVLEAKFMKKGVKFNISDQCSFLPEGVVDFLIQNSPSAKGSYRCWVMVKGGYRSYEREFDMQKFCQDIGIKRLLQV